MGIKQLQRDGKSHGFSPIRTITMESYKCSTSRVHDKGVITRDRMPGSLTMEAHKYHFLALII